MVQIQLVLVDDWELRGDGSGDMRAIQFSTLSRILSIYERHGLRASINAEVMQQLYHRAYSAEYPELGVLADEWDDVVRDAYRRGHDVQVHVHSQWTGARYSNGKWELPGDWSILRHPPEEARTMIQRAKSYLAELLKPINQDYSCVSFRSGAWCIAPSEWMLQVLVDEGFRATGNRLKG